MDQIQQAFLAKSIPELLYIYWYSDEEFAGETMFLAREALETLATQAET